MDHLALFAIGIVGTVVPVFSPEATAGFYGHTARATPAAIAVLLSAGQAVTYTALYFGGAKLIDRWSGLRDAVARTRTRFASHLEGRFLFLSLLAGTIGLPPAVAVSALAPGFRIPYLHLIPVLFVCRLARFFVLATAGANATSLWQWLGLGT